MNTLLQKILNAISGVPTEDPEAVTVPQTILTTMEQGLAIADVQENLPTNVMALVKQVRQIVRTKQINPEQISFIMNYIEDEPMEELEFSDEIGENKWLNLIKWLIQTLLGEKGDGAGYNWLREQNQIAQTKHLSSFFVTKGVDGQYRWFGWVTNKWEDREGEILTDAAHRDFLAFLDEHPEAAPELWSWHTVGTARKHKADWWDYINGFLMFSGPLTDAEAQPYVDGRVKKERIGMSHGFYVLDRQGRFITKYRTFEVSELPHDVAANPFTDFRVKEEQLMFSERKRAFLVERFGEDVVAKLEQETEDREKMLEKLGVSWKEISEQYQAELENAFAEKVARATEPAVKQVTAQVIEAMNLEGLQNALKTLFQELQDLKGIATEVEQLREIVEHLKQTEDARIAAAIAPSAPFNWNFSVQKAKGNEENVKKRVEASQDHMNWLEGFKIWEDK